MVRYLHSILLAGLLAGVLALGLGVGAAATAPMEPLVPPKAPTEPSDPETNGEMYGWGTGGASLVYDRSVWYVREKKTRGINSGEWQSETYNEHVTSSVGRTPLVRSFISAIATRLTGRFFRMRASPVSMMSRGG